jgi:hypothetical protein
MAALKKYTHKQVIYILRHNSREHPKPPSNVDIDPKKSMWNYYLSPVRHGCDARSCKAYYRWRLNQLYHMNRRDVKTVCQWIVTAPKDLDTEEFHNFFQSTYDFLNSLYGEENCIQCIVHFDEGVKDSSGKIIAGRPHLHYLFIPAVKNPKYGKKNKKGNLTEIAKYKEKVCADQLISLSHLQRFHPLFQKWINKNGPKCTVHSGVTKGKNKTVKELKQETKQMLAAREKIKALEEENTQHKEAISGLQQQLKQTQSQGWGSDASWDNNSGWGTASAWGKENEWNKDL